MAVTERLSLSVTVVEDASSTVAAPPGCLLFASVDICGCAQRLQLVACAITADWRVLGASPALQRLVDLALAADPVTYGWAPGTVPDPTRAIPALVRVRGWPDRRYLAVLAPVPREASESVDKRRAGGRDARVNPVPGDAIYNGGEVMAVYHERMSVDRWRNLAKSKGATVKAIKDGGSSDHA